MRTLAVIPALAAAFSLTGCQIMRDDLRHSGGIAGKQLDRRIFDATKSQELQLTRAVAIVSLASRVAVGTLEPEESADYIRRLSGVLLEINHLASDINMFGTTRSHCDYQTRSAHAIDPTKCETRSVLFESNLPQLEYRVMGLVVASLPKRQASSLASSVATGDWASAAWKALKTAIASVDGAHRGAAAYRSTVQILADNSSQCGKEATTVETAIQCLDGKTDNLTELSLLHKQGVQAVPSIHAMFALIQTSCRLMPMSLDTSSAGRSLTERKEDCQEMMFKEALRFAS